MRAAEALAAMRALPVAGLDEILRGRSPMVLAPHPDDESLGCGGLLAASVAAGLDPFVLVVTDGSASHPGSAEYPPPRLAAVRREEAVAAVAELGLSPERIGFLALEDGAAPHAGAGFSTAVASIIDAAKEAGSGVLLSTWRNDPHADHVATHLMAVEAAHHARLAHLAYPVWGWTLPADAELEDPAPAGWRLDVRPWLEAKRAAIRAHRTQSSDLITDIPDPFRLPDDLLAPLLAPYETYLTVP